jgi:ABC-type transporter Mla subunit MlaD
MTGRVDTGLNESHSSARPPWQAPGDQLMVAQPPQTRPDLEQLIAELTRALAESRERQAAAGEILRVIAGSPTDLQAVLDTIAESAARLCGASDVVINRIDGEWLPVVATFGAIMRGGGADRSSLVATR